MSRAGRYEDYPQDEPQDYDDTVSQNVGGMDGWEEHGEEEYYPGEEEGWDYAPHAAQKHRFIVATPNRELICHAKNKFPGTAARKAASKGHKLIVVIADPRCRSFAPNKAGRMYIYNGHRRTIPAAKRSEFQRANNIKYSGAVHRIGSLPPHEAMQWMEGAAELNPELFGH